jgi:ubiquinone/menaquinone biosynthesis C-methylase UbiE
MNDYEEKYFENYQGMKYDFENILTNRIITAIRIMTRFHPLTIFEVGCAKGYQLLAFNYFGINCMGMDISEYATHNTVPELKDRIITADVSNGIPSKDEMFNLVFSDACLEHIEIDKIPFVLKEMHRVTQKWVVIHIPIGLSFENKPFGDLTHKTYMPVGWWIKNAYEVGLNFDLRYSTHYSVDADKYQNAELVFYKGDLVK